MELMKGFEYNTSPARVIFGSGTIKKLPEEIARQNLTAPLVLSTPHQVQQAEALKTILNSNVAGIFTEAAMHTPIDITNKAVEYAKTVEADSIISIGGGSTIGLGKAISIRTGLPHICIPTTYAGSEMTPVLGETAEGQKKTRSDPKILPATVIYDVDLTMTLPTGMTATSGVNAIAHAVEALYAQNTNPIIHLLALEGIKALASSLPTLTSSLSSLPARTSALYGAWLCGTCLGAVGMSLHHKLCHTLGGSFSLPHSETHTIILPHALAYNAPSIPAAVLSALASVLDGSDGDAVQGMNVLIRKLGWSGRGLREFGMREEDVSRAAELVVETPYWNPRKVEVGPVRELIRRAWAGEEARADL